MARGATFVVDGSQKCLSTNALDLACTELAKGKGFASIMTIDKGAVVQGKK